MPHAIHAYGDGWLPDVAATVSAMRIAQCSPFACPAQIDVNGEVKAANFDVHQPDVCADILPSSWKCVAASLAHHNCKEYCTEHSVQGAHYGL